MRHILLSVLLLALSGCSAPPPKKPSEDEEVASRARTYLRMYFPTMNYQMSCPDGMYLYAHGSDIYFCTVTAGTRVMTLGCKKSSRSNISCVMFASTYQ